MSGIIILGDISYDSGRSFQGDGYSLSVHHFDQNLKRYSEKPPDSFFKSYPIRPGYRSHWYTVFWKRSPIDQKYYRYLDFSLSSYDRDNEPILEEYYKCISVLLKSKGHFYSFFYYDHSDYPANIDFFLVDMERCEIYVINHNT